MGATKWRYVTVTLPLLWLSIAAPELTKCQLVPWTWTDRSNLGSVDSALGLGPTTPIKADSGPGRGILRGRHQFPR